MESLKMSENYEERKLRRRALQVILHSLSCSFISDANLKDLQIRKEFMSLEKEDHKPLYFEPYGAPIQPPVTDTISDYYPTLYESPFRNAKSLAWYLNEYFRHCVLPEQEQDPPGSLYTGFKGLDFGLLADRFEEPRWQVKAAWTTRIPGIPHLKALMYSSAIGNPDGLFHAELQVIIRLMYGRLKTKSLRPHVVIPVLLFSVVGMHHIRVLEGYFAHGKLTIRVTKLYDLEEQNHELLIQFARWWLGHPGDKPTKED
ncbi:hypothetical protein FQN54_001128 [Arachnomyces sp. PD_36]|nr:hypothetical protein FQN54_001128 [Arachnomyces sp. PD_36]